MLSTLGLFFSETTFHDLFCNWKYLLPVLLLLIVAAQLILFFVVTCVKKTSNAFSILFLLIVASLVLCFAGTFSKGPFERHVTSNDNNQTTEQKKESIFQTSSLNSDQKNENNYQTVSLENSKEDKYKKSPNPTFSNSSEEIKESAPSIDSQPEKIFNTVGISAQTPSLNQDRSSSVFANASDSTNSTPPKPAPTNSYPGNPAFSEAEPYSPGQYPRSNVAPETNSNERTGQFVQPPVSVQTVPNRIKDANYSEPLQPKPQNVISPTSFDQSVKTPSIGENTPLTPEIRNSIINSSVQQFNKLANESDETCRQAILRCKASTVYIEAKIYKDKNASRAKTSDETGSGILFERKNRLFVLTNFHVAGRAVDKSSVYITFQDRRIVNPIAIFPCSQADIALLEIDRNSLPSSIFTKPIGEITDSNVFVATLGDSDQVKMLDKVFSIGSPFGLLNSVSQGIISGCNRREIPLGVQDQIQGFLQTDAAINPGNSGGPLSNTRGEVIAVVTAIASKHGSGSGIAFALPINTALKIVDQFIANGTWQQGYLGAEYDMYYSNEDRKNDGITNIVGARITEVSTGSPADKFGFKSGDVILTYDDIPIEDASQLKQLVSLSDPGYKPRIVVWRDKKSYLAQPLLIGNTVYANNK